MEQREQRPEAGSVPAHLGVFEETGTSGLGTREGDGPRRWDRTPAEVQRSQSVPSVGQDMGEMKAGLC